MYDLVNTENLAQSQKKSKQGLNLHVLGWLDVVNQTGDFAHKPCNLFRAILNYIMEDNSHGRPFTETSGFFSSSAS